MRWIGGVALLFPGFSAAMNQAMHVRQGQGAVHSISRVPTQKL